MRAIEDVTSYTRPESSKQPTPDWRLWLSGGEQVDLEVTQATDGRVRSHWAQLTKKNGRSKVWPDAHLTHDWVVVVGVTSPVPEPLRAKDVVKAVIRVLIEVEQLEMSPAEMAQVARSRFILPEEFFNNPGWMTSLQRADRAGVSWEDWLMQHSGYWYPPLLADDAQERHGDCRVWVVKDPVPAVGPHGTVRTHPYSSEGSAGHEALINAIQHRIDDKAEKGQTANSAGQEWLAVVVEGIAAWDLRENVRKGVLESDLIVELGRIALRCFDQVWVLTRGGEDHAVLRISQCRHERTYQVARTPALAPIFHAGV